jgi:hypothetical protein
MYDSLDDLIEESIAKTNEEWLEQRRLDQLQVDLRAEEEEQEMWYYGRRCYEEEPAYYANYWF